MSILLLEILHQEILVKNILYEYLDIQNIYSYFHINFVIFKYYFFGYNKQ